MKHDTPLEQAPIQAWTIRRLDLASSSSWRMSSLSSHDTIMCSIHSLTDFYWSGEHHKITTLKALAKEASLHILRYPRCELHKRSMILLLQSPKHSEERSNGEICNPRLCALSCRQHHHHHHFCFYIIDADSSYVLCHAHITA
eukprot:2336828-Amphidinium_carterae.1